jgi:hypothetical protein
MTPSQALDSLRRQLAQHGRDVVIRRWSGPSGARTATEVTTRARIVGYAPEKIVGAIQVGDRKAIVQVDALAALLPLKDTDKVVIDGREFAIRYVDDQTRRIGNTLIALELQISG